MAAFGVQQSLLMMTMALLVCAAAAAHINKTTLLKHIANAMSQLDNQVRKLHVFLVCSFSFKIDMSVLQRSHICVISVRNQNQVSAKDKRFMPSMFKPRKFSVLSIYI